ncbi:MAG: indole-3-glycerol phosphate synthase TrpC [Candidatus Omnitrophota bacterium]|jgi:indole-3-glycerol phosphate synthase|nr:MAG: indole-3-glycerol phosphate synthase TrpC [Candidatus Omnitrophota bacterium]
MMSGILEEIIQHKKIDVESRKRARPLETLIEAAAAVPPARDFPAALQRGDGPVKLLAEIKAASPSAGVIRELFDAAEIALVYESCGAAAVSVLTDFKYFAGTYDHLRQAKAAVSVPVLRKDFTIDAYQLYESKVIGADAVLLMAQVLDEETYVDLLQLATQLGLHVLAEGHTSEQIRFLASIGAQTIGINNRDFRTMTVDIRHTLRNRRLVPDDRVLVSQSGISTRGEVTLLQGAGVDAIQVGTSLMRNADIKDSFHALTGKR